MATGSGDRATFEEVDWSAVDDGNRSPTGRTLAFLTALGVLAVAFGYDYLLADGPLVAGWSPTALDWLSLVGVAAFACYVVAPLAQNRHLTRRYWRQLRRDRLAVASLCWLVFFALFALVGPVILGDPETAPMGMGATEGRYGIPIYQPPVGFGVSEYATPVCSGPISGGKCWGTLLHPLGTTNTGKDVLAFVARGARIELQLAFVAGSILVPIATVVGTVSAQFGGRVDSLLMRYVDLQQVIPAFFVYLVAQFLYGGSLLLMVVVFGLLNWGGVARLVRSEALKKRETGYVKAAQAAGSGRLAVVRRHLMPNVSNAVVTAITLQIPMLLVIETTLSYLGLGPMQGQSWGYLIETNIHDANFPTLGWWSVAAPVGFLVATVVSLNLLGDALRDVLDPRTDGKTSQTGGTNGGGHR
ncbi:ABC transporter permease [Halorussus lipolyticus]|uniref:ABC transporter permease n=1 Tax=Halorussus lipolyticus TaxID=3034024 RepID=UPI0023E7B086|nr:ABC transporter permease [Halorussus sp. DT80]